ncbi:MAG TPA: ribosome biogenesis GTPase Der [Gemmatimonadaceae bacterium]|nr:ribosome biogenesis GTPase Der [Gemmatimonadaceae bacterium]
MTNIPVVALIGRPNVGKSALFNRLAGGDAAIVTSQAGTTRDRNFARAEWNGRTFWLVDTGGLTDDPSVPMDVEIRRQVMQAIAEADVLLFVVDAQAGIHPQDERVLEILRESGKPWLVAANKVDDPRTADHYEFYNLGAAEVHPVSAKNGKGSGDLLDALVERFPERMAEESDALHVAVVGRPNVGKSSIVNRLLGEERLVVSATSGTTRDAIDTPMQYHGRTLVFIDTAGLRRQSKVDEGIEFYSTLRTRRAIERADVCVLVIDATEGLENQDLRIATMAWERGAGLILVVNKWDLVEKGDKTADVFRKNAGEKAPFLRYVPFLFTSALTGQRVMKLLDTIIAVQGERERRITTARVNERLGELLARLQPPQAAGQEVKLNYATQVEVEPPTFAIFGNHPELIAENYLRYLQNGFRESWGFMGSPLRIVLRRKAA